MKKLTLLFTVTSKLDVSVTSLISVSKTSRIFVMRAKMLQMRKTTTTIISMTASFISFFSWAERFERFLLDLLKKQKCKVVEGLVQYNSHF
jgi:hypothetical protein